MHNFQYPKRSCPFIPPSPLPLPLLVFSRDPSHALLLSLKAHFIDHQPARDRHVEAIIDPIEYLALFILMLAEPRHWDGFRSHDAELAYRVVALVWSDLLVTDPQLGPQLVRVPLNVVGVNGTVEGERDFLLFGGAFTLQRLEW